MTRLSTSNRLILLVVVLTSLLFMVGTFGLIGIYRTNDALKTVYLDRTVPMWQLSEIQRLTQRDWLIVSIAEGARSPEFTAKYAPDADSNLATVHKLYDDYLKTYLTPEEKIRAEKFKIDLTKFDLDALRPALAALKVANYNEVRRLEMEVMIPLSERYHKDLQALIQIQLNVASSEYNAAMIRFDNTRLASILSMVVGLIFAISFGGFLVRSIIKSKLEFEQSEYAKRELERQLQQSQKVQALGQLTSGIAHDFNNILAAILGYSNLALERFVPDKQSKLAKYLGEIISASERARDLIAKMLTFTRTQLNAKVGLVSPANVVREVESMMIHSIPSSIELHTRTDVDIRILIDAGELNQVLVNLIINARDAINGQGRIDINLRNVEVVNQISLISQRRFSGNFLALDVSDTGTGIAPENLPRLFDPFFTTKDVGKGTGLGLSMVHGIMTRAGGHVLVRSTLGKGSCFQLLFPIPVSGQPDSPTSAIVSSSISGTGQLIWVLDDEISLTGYLSELLSGWGFQVRSFNDPHKLLNAFKTEVPKVNLLITDMTMPGLSGIDLVSQLHSLDPNIQTILCTGTVEGINAAEIANLGVTNVLVKPISNGELVTALLSVFPPLSRGS